jgi:opacity protein-like surface antigen
MSRLTRVHVFALVAVACMLTAAAAIAAAAMKAGPDEASGGTRVALSAARDAGQPTVVFRSLAGGSRDRVGIAPLDGGAGVAQLSALRCERVYFAGGSGLCVARGSGFAAGYRVKVFGADMRVRHELDVAGIPSRARVSREGRVGAVTMFVAGHAYAGGAFSTQTTLIDLRSGTSVADLEDFTVSRRGRVITAEDLNFWGVTFAAGGDSFYATMATGGKTYLVRGSIRDRTMRTLHENVECPSLSPDGTRIAYKKRVGARDTPWRLTVLDLATMRETPLGEPQGFDDQAEWVDDEHVAYGIGGEVRVVAADGSGAPRRLRAAADSPAVVRW